MGAEYYLYNQGVDAAPAGNGAFRKNPSNLYEEPTACRVTTANNPCLATGSAVDTEVTLEGRGTPYLLDTFTGAITPTAEYSSTKNSVTVKVSLDTDASTVIALLHEPKRLGVAPTSNVAVASTTADSAALEGNKLVIRATEAGSHSTTLTNGRTVKSNVGAAPAEVNLTNKAWHLDAQDWKPTNPYGTQGPAGTATTKVHEHDGTTVRKLGRRRMPLLLSTRPCVPLQGSRPRHGSRVPGLRPAPGPPVQQPRRDPPRDRGALAPPIARVADSSKGLGGIKLARLVAVRARILVPGSDVQPRTHEELPRVQGSSSSGSSSGQTNAVASVRIERPP